MKEATTKEFFPSVEKRLAVNLNLNPNVTTIMTGHGNIQFYLHRLKIIESPPMQTRHSNGRPSHIPVQEAKELKRNSEERCT